MLLSQLFASAGKKNTFLGVTYFGRLAGLIPDW